MAQKIFLPTHAEEAFAKLAKENLDGGGEIVELLGFLVGTLSSEGATVSDLVLPVQLGTASKVDDLGICGKDSSMWMFEDLECAKANKDNFCIIAWAHTHVQGTPCGLSSIDCHTQYAYSKMFSNVSAVVLEVKDDGTHKMDWFQLTEEGHIRVEECSKNNNLSREQHHDCSSLSMYKSCSSMVETRLLPLAMTDARQTKPLDSITDKHYKEPLIHISGPPVVPACRNCLKEFPSEQKLLGHVSRAKKCKELYGAEYDSLRKKIYQARLREQNQKRKAQKHKWYEDNKHHILKKNLANKERAQKRYQANKQKMQEKYQANKEKMQEKYQANKEKMQEKYQANKGNFQVAYQTMSPAKKQKLLAGSKEYYKNNKTDIGENRRKSRVKKQSPIVDFKKSICKGPVCPCISCHRLMFPSSVHEVCITELEKKFGEELLSNTVMYTEMFYNDGKLYMCNTCLQNLRKGKRPTMSSCNGLHLDIIPPALKLSELEQQLIAKRLLFMKIFKLPRSRMSGIKDKVVNVPLEDADLKNTSESLPRQATHSSLVNVRLKRMKNMKNVHNQEYIRPEAVREALLTLKQLGNPHYQFEFSANLKNDSDIDTDSSHSSSTDGLEEEIEEEEDNDDNHNMYTAATCMVHENPETLVVINKTNEVMRKQIASAEIEIAPGEGKVPTNWLKEQDFDVLSFPTLFPTGKYGCDFDREQKLSKQKYFTQRILNIDRRFSQDMSYLFAAQQRVEREQMEQQFNLVVQKGKLTDGMDGKTIMSTTDNFAAFKKIRGTPKYFQQVRNELVAKVGQLGPFHLFFTLSCGEKRWDEIIAALLEMEGRHVKHCSNDEEGSALSFNVDEMPLNDFLEKNQLTKQRLLQDNIVQRCPQRRFSAHFCVAFLVSRFL